MPGGEELQAHFPRDVIVQSNAALGYNATCTGNTPALSQDGPEDGPNTVGGVSNGC